MITTTIISTTSLSTRKASQREQQFPHMTSLEVAEICGKRHNDIMRAIRNMEPAWEKNIIAQICAIIPKSDTT